MDIHERPGFGNGISPRNGSNPPLRKGMILTIEPGIYFKGEGGIRIEDDILVTAKGAKTLNRLSRQLKDMVLI